MCHTVSKASDDSDCSAERVKKAKRPRYVAQATLRPEFNYNGKVLLSRRGDKHYDETAEQNYKKRIELL